MSIKEINPFQCRFCESAILAPDYGENKFYCIECCEIKNGNDYCEEQWELNPEYTNLKRINE